MKNKKLLYLGASLIPSISLAQQVIIPQEVHNDTIYVQQANITPSANQVGNPRIILTQTGAINTYSSGSQNFADINNNQKNMPNYTNNISIAENYVSIGGEKIFDGLNVLLGKTFAKNGIAFENGASILPNGTELKFLAGILNFVNQDFKIGNVFDLNGSQANFAVAGNIAQNLTLNTTNISNGFEIDDTTQGPLTDHSIVSADYDGVVASSRTLAQNAIHTDHFAAGAVQEGNIQTGAATKEKFVPGAVTTNKIAFLTLVTNLFARGAISSDNIPNGSIDALKVDSSSVQLRVTGKGDGRMAIQNINQDGTVGLIEVCLRPKNMYEMTNGGQVWMGKDPEWMKWGGSSCSWQNVKKTCSVCDARTGTTRDTWQGQWNTKSEDSWQNCENYCPRCVASYNEYTTNGSCSSKTTTTITYTLQEGGNDYGTKGGTCTYTSTSNTVSTPDTTSAACKPAQSNNDSTGGGNKGGSGEGGGGGYYKGDDGQKYKDEAGTEKCTGKCNDEIGPVKK